MSEPITEEDLDWLTRAENRLMSLRKRETEHRGRNAFLSRDFTNAIQGIHEARRTLQVRFEKKPDEPLP